MILTILVKDHNFNENHNSNEKYHNCSNSNYNSNVNYYDSNAFMNLISNAEFLHQLKTEIKIIHILSLKYFSKQKRF